MPFDPVPFFVGGGAVHTPEVFRALAYAATGGQEGIVQPADLKVVPLAVPGGGVMVSIGGGYALSRAANAAEQTYVFRHPTPTQVDITPAGSSGSKAVMIVARVEDPWVAGEPWDDPSDPTVGPYVFIRAIDCNGSTTKLRNIAGHANDTGIELARINIPANTGTITSAMITDLRKIARPRETHESLVDLGSSTGTLTSAAGTLFPPYQPSILVPDWATHMRCDLSISQLSAQGSSNGFANVSVRASDGTTVVIDGDQMAFNADVSSGSNTRFVHLATAYGDIRAQRGNLVRPSSYMRKEVAGRGDLRYDQYAQMRFDITFYERIV